MSNDSQSSQDASADDESSGGQRSREAGFRAGAHGKSVTSGTFDDRTPEGRPVHTHVNSGWEEAQGECAQCGWSGVGQEANAGPPPDDPDAPFWQVRCPACGYPMLQLAWSTEDQLSDAADRGHPGAISELAASQRRERFVARVEASQAVDPTSWPKLEGDALDFQLTLTDDENGDCWLLLSPLTDETRDLELDVGDPSVIHVELAAWENPEPAGRIARLLEQRYGARFRYLDPWPATLYLCGDVISHASRIKAELGRHAPLEE